MKAVIQRVSRARVMVGDRLISEIGTGLLILLGIKKDDTEEGVRDLANKCCDLRIFEDDTGKFNRSLKDIKGEALVVSQFTLLADTSRGRRPSFTDAEEPGRAEILYERFISSIRETGIAAVGGVFGARMLVELQNNGPVTIIMEA